MTKFEALKGITDVKKFSELLFDILADRKTMAEIEELLLEELTEKQLQTLQSVAESGNYPLSLDGRQ